MGKRYGLYFVEGFVKGTGVGYLFYRSQIALFLGSVYGIYSLIAGRKKQEKAELEEITLEFQQGLQGIASALSAGYSMENAIGEAKKDLILLYGENGLLVKEFSWIQYQLELNQTVEYALFLFAQKWKGEDILHFAQVFQTAKRTGGNLIEITKETAEKISEKIEIQREIQTMIAGKKLEARIMNGIPLGMILYFWICSPGFLDCMYQGQGRIVMTILLAVYLVAYKWSDSISTIKV